MKNPDSLQASSGSEQTTSLPEPDFTPTWPKPDSLGARCLVMLLAGNSLSHHDFIIATGSHRLAAVVFDLKKLGWSIESKRVTKTGTDSSKRAVCHYCMHAKAIAQAAKGCSR